MEHNFGRWRKKVKSEKERMSWVKMQKEESQGKNSNPEYKYKCQQWAMGLILTSTSAAIFIPLPQ